MQIQIPQTNSSVRVQGNQIPPFINGRSRSIYTKALTPNRAQTPKDLTPAMKATGAQIGTGVPFGALYMTRTSKKHAVLRSVA